MYEYRAVIVKVQDGDSVVVDIDLGLRTWRRKEPIRLVGLNAPRGSTPEGQAATAWLSARLPVGAVVTLRTEKDRTEKYGRWLGTILTNDEWVSVNQQLIELAFCQPWDGRGAKPGDG